jgi:hypothetical protein
MLKDSKGNKSLTTTLLVCAFAITSINYLIAMFEQLFSFPIRAFDPAAAASYLGFVASLYGWRRQTESKERTAAAATTEGE